MGQWGCLLDNGPKLALAAKQSFKKIMVHQSIKEPVLLLQLESATFHCVASGYKFYIMNSTFFSLLPYLPLACFCTTPFGTCSRLYITVYFVEVSTFAFDSQPFIIPFLAFRILYCSTVFAVIKFLVPFHFFTHFVSDLCQQPF